MTLDEYMTRNDISDEDAARALGVAHRITVNRYRRGKRLPCREVMTRIHRWSGGQVTANDFFGLSQEESHAA
jgi:transcriptional regulator with XRE-family HTH domain